MNVRNRIAYLTAAALLVAGCSRERHGFGTRTVDVQRSWPAAQIQTLEVSEVDGNVDVRAVAGDQITLVAKARGDLDIRKNEENQGLFETRLSGNTLWIGRHEERHFRIPIIFGREDVQIDYELRVPASMTLTAKTVNGRITTRGIEGETEARTVNGTIDIETAGTHELSATTVNGRVRAKFLQNFNGARFKTVNGGVEAFLPQNASFSVDLAQVNGDFEASFPLSIHSNPGSRHVSGEVNGGEHELKIVTVNGDVELSKLGDSL